jgi:hypothetical protein
MRDNVHSNKDLPWRTVSNERSQIGHVFNAYPLSVRDIHHSYQPPVIPGRAAVLLAMTGFSGMYNQDTSSPPTSGTHWQLPLQAVLLVLSNKQTSRSAEKCQYCSSGEGVHLNKEVRYKIYRARTWHIGWLTAAIRYNTVTIDLSQMEYSDIRRVGE